MDQILKNEEKITILLKNQKRYLFRNGNGIQNRTESCNKSFVPEASFIKSSNYSIENNIWNVDSIVPSKCFFPSIANSCVKFWLLMVMLLVSSIDLESYYEIEIVEHKTIANPKFLWLTETRICEAKIRRERLNETIRFSTRSYHGVIRY